MTLDGVPTGFWALHADAVRQVQAGTHLSQLISGPLLVGAPKAFALLLTWSSTTCGRHARTQAETERSSNYTPNANPPAWANTTHNICNALDQNTKVQAYERSVGKECSSLLAWHTSQITGFQKSRRITFEQRTNLRGNNAHIQRCTQKGNGPKAKHCWGNLLFKRIYTQYCQMIHFCFTEKAWKSCLSPW